MDIGNGMIAVRGIGWLTRDGYGSVGSGLEQTFEAGEGVVSLSRRGIVPTPYRNFGRLDPLSRSTIGAVALALGDAGLSCSPGDKQATGIVGTARDGSLAADVAFFRDYLENGRTLARGNLFIYTLPTSPLGEAAIQFGLTGPLLHVAGAAAPLDGALALAAEMVAGGEAPQMLAGEADAASALYLLIDRAAAGGALCSLAEARAIAAKGDGVAAMAAQFSALLTRKGDV
jgi:3-oxoacyl-[acyl-carrier-protein] synthase II